jgi:hypothetical protein
MIRRLESLPIKGEHVPLLSVDVLEEDGRIFFIADADIDADGVGDDGFPHNPDHDPYYQTDTTYHFQGRAINPYRVPGIVVPPSIARLVKPIVLGCKARLTYRRTGLSCLCIVHDLGPTFKLGECTPEAAKRVGIPPSPVNGGEDSYDEVIYEIWPGETVVIDNVAYPLQPLSVD